MSVKLNNITKSYGDNVIYNNADFSFEDGKITCILGASGCGKSTLLNIIGGLTEFSGKVEIDGGRGISYMFQETRLLPNLTVSGNLHYALRGAIKNKLLRSKLIEDMLKQLKIEETAKLYPNQLSGGMMQRVSLGRAFLYPSDLLLMDEPFKGMDISLKKHILELFRELYIRLPRTVIFVTHDIEEALALANRIIVLVKGGQVALDSDNLITEFNNLQEKNNYLRQKIYEVL